MTPPDEWSPPPCRPHVQRPGRVPTQEHNHLSLELAAEAADDSDVEEAEIFGPDRARAARWYAEGGADAPSAPPLAALKGAAGGAGAGGPRVKMVNSMADSE